MIHLQQENQGLFLPPTKKANLGQIKACFGRKKSGVMFKVFCEKKFWSKKKY